MGRVVFVDRDFKGEGEKFSGEPSTGIIKRSSSGEVDVPGGGSKRSGAGESSRGENVISWGVTALLGRYHFPGVGGKPENFSGVRTNQSAGNSRRGGRLGLVTTQEDESSRDVESWTGWVTDGIAGWPGDWFVGAPRPDNSWRVGRARSGDSTKARGRWGGSAE